MFYLSYLQKVISEEDLGIILVSLRLFLMSTVMNVT